MATEKKSLGTAKRFGVRYGPTLKQKVAAIEASSRADHECPYCGKVKAHRLSVGIWECRKCATKFTAKAYGIAKKITFAKKAEDETFVLKTRASEEEVEA